MSDVPAETAAPTLLYNDECAVCRGIARWVSASLASPPAAPTLLVAPIGSDPAALRARNPELDIWDAYATIHLLMPDGSMKRGGEAVAEVLRRLPRTRWFAGLFDVTLFGVRPFQASLNAGYTVLSEARPLFGCESCGTSNAVVRVAAAAIAWLKSPYPAQPQPSRARHRSSIGRVRLHDPE